MLLISNEAIFVPWPDHRTVIWFIERFKLKNWYDHVQDQYIGREHELIEDACKVMDISVALIWHEHKRELVIITFDPTPKAKQL